MQASAVVSLKNLLVLTLLAGSLVFAAVSLNAPPWRRWTKSTSASAGAADERQPAPPQGAADAAEDSAAEEIVPDEGGPQLALALSDAGEEEIVDAVANESDEAQPVAPVFWGEALHAEEPARNDAGGDDVAQDADAEPGLLPCDRHAVDAESAGGDELSRDRFAALERRLRELGATQYRLETWGADDELFRFRCLMAISDAERYNRFFEATDADALSAFEKVLEEVEECRANQHASAP